MPRTSQVRGTYGTLKEQSDHWNIYRMSKRKTIFLVDHYYHIFNRGVNKNPIFHEDDNYLYLIKLIKKWSSFFNISIISYCLMPNHYHLLLKQKSDHKISNFIYRLFNTYSKAFNKRFKRSGTLFEGRFKSIHVDSTEYLIHLCRYIHRNPIDSNPPLVKRLEDWPYSNYPEWIGERKGKLVDSDFINSLSKEGLDYRQFVKEGSPLKVRKRYEKFLFD